MDKGKQASGSGGARKAAGAGIGDELRSMLADQGKGTSSAAGGAMMQEAMRDMQISDAPASSAGKFRETNTRSRTPTALDAEYSAFQGREPVTDRIAPNANVDFMEKAWHSSVAPAPAPQPATQVPQPAAQPTQPVAQPTPARAPDLQADANNFLSALNAEAPEPDAIDQPQAPVLNVALIDEWRPPSPSHGSVMSHEQYAMHERLAMLQTGVNTEQPYRQAEGIVPPADDAALSEGVYAPTPQAALANVWDAQQARAAHVQQFREDEKTKPISGPSYTKIRGQEVVDKLRGWLVREGYTGEVYGLPPMVMRTFGEATAEANNEQDEERRAKAIRRLDALYRHLSAPSHTTRGPADMVMEDWLQKHSE